MRRSALLSVALAGVLAAGTAMAADQGSGATPSGTTGSQTGAGTETGTGRASGTGTEARHGTEPAAAAPQTARFAGQHQMTGTVTDIDESSGRITLNAEGQQLQLHFPQDALRNIKRGDRVTVALGIREAGGGGGTTGAPGAGGVAPRSGAAGSGAPGDMGNGAGAGSGTLRHVGPSGEGGAGTP
jgi:hypothetical protein